MFCNIVAKKICNKTHILIFFIDEWYLIVIKAENTK